MSAEQFVDLGRAKVKRLSDKAALIWFEDQARTEDWVPYSQMSTLTASKCTAGNTIDRFRVTQWLAGKLEK